MANVSVYNMEGKEVGTIELNDAVFGVEINEHLVHMAVVQQLANKRQGTHSTLTKSEVSGGGKKPYKQKGTGHARQGSTRAPQWIKGGVALGPKPRDYRITMNKKTKRVALYSALSAKVAEGNLIVVDDIKLDTYKTAEMVKMLKALGCEKQVTVTYKDAETKKIFDETHQRTCKKRTATVAEKALVVLPEIDAKVIKSFANIEGNKTAQVNTINVYDVLNCDTLIVAKAAVEKIEEVYA